MDVKDPYNPSNLQLTPEMVALVKKPRMRRRPRRVFAGDFVPAIPLEWAAKAGRLPGKAFQVAVAIWRQAAIVKNTTLSVRNGPLEMFGVCDAGAKRRAILALEEAGLIKVDHRPGAYPIVTILEVEDMFE